MSRETHASNSITLLVRRLTDVGVDFSFGLRCCGGWNLSKIKTVEDVAFVRGFEERIAYMCEGLTDEQVLVAMQAANAKSVERWRKRHAA